LAARNKKAMSLLYMDLDGMKTINDELGHKAGDQALVDTANILKMTFRESDIIARIGGDEFAVLLTEHAESDIENIITSHLKDNLRIHNEQAGRNFELLLSMGFVHHDPDHLCSIDKLLAQADDLMYLDKKHHKIEQEVIPLLRETTERRVYKRFSPGNNCWAKLNGSGRIKIKDISIGGICLKTSQQLFTKSTHKIKFISSDNEKIAPTAEVVWSYLSGTTREKDDILPHYQSGLKFIEMNNSLKNSLETFITSLANQ
jgi:diguanylate cyclase (GGDEF)-like protein